MWQEGQVALLQGWWRERVQSEHDLSRTLVDMAEIDQLARLVGVPTKNAPG